MNWNKRNETREKKETKQVEEMREKTHKLRRIDARRSRKKKYIRRSTNDQSIETRWCTLTIINSINRDFFFTFHREKICTINKKTIPHLYKVSFLLSIRWTTIVGIVIIYLILFYVLYMEFIQKYVKYYFYSCQCAMLKMALFSILLSVAHSLVCPYVSIQIKLIISKEIFVLFHYYYYFYWNIIAAIRTYDDIEGSKK